MGVDLPFVWRRTRDQKVGETPPPRPTDLVHVDSWLSLEVVGRSHGASGGFGSCYRRRVPPRSIGFSGSSNEADDHTADLHRAALQDDWLDGWVGGTEFHATL